MRTRTGSRGSSSSQIHECITLPPPEDESGNRISGGRGEEAAEGIVVSSFSPSSADLVGAGRGDGDDGGGGNTEACGADVTGTTATVSLGPGAPDGGSASAAAADDGTLKDAL